MTILRNVVKSQTLQGAKSGLWCMLTDQDEEEEEEELGYIKWLDTFWIFHGILRFSNFHLLNCRFPFIVACMLSTFSGVLHVEGHSAAPWPNLKCQF